MEDNGQKKGCVTRHKDGKLWLAVCPQCGEKNHVEAVETGRCIWCGYQATDADVRVDEASGAPPRQILHG